MSKPARHQLLNNYLNQWTGKNSKGAGTSLKLGEISLYEGDWQSAYTDRVTVAFSGADAPDESLLKKSFIDLDFFDIIFRGIREEIYRKRRTGKSLRFHIKNMKLEGSKGNRKFTLYYSRKNPRSTVDIEKVAENWCKNALRKTFANQRNAKKVAAYFKKEGYIVGLHRDSPIPSTSQGTKYQQAEYSHGKELPKIQALELPKPPEYKFDNKRNRKSLFAEAITDPKRRGGKHGFAGGATGTKAVANIGKALKEITAIGNLYNSGLAAVLNNWLYHSFGYKDVLKKNRHKKGINDTFILEAIMIDPGTGKNRDIWDTVIKESYTELLGGVDKNGNPKDDPKSFLRYVKESGMKSLQSPGVAMGKAEALKIFTDSKDPYEWLTDAGPKLYGSELLGPISKRLNRPDMRFKVNKELLKKIQADKKTSKGRINNKGRIKNRKVPRKKFTVAATAASARNKSRKTGIAAPVHSPTTGLALRELLNKVLPAQVERNMGIPKLEYRTGRFANSAEVTSVIMGPRGGMYIDYTYQKDPYQVFEPGLGAAPWANQYRDPKHIIGQSIRQIVAANMKGMQPILRRV